MTMMTSGLIPTNFTGEEFILSILSYVEAQGAKGATYLEWWTWFRDTYNKNGGVAADTFLQYRGTCTSRWSEAINVKIIRHNGEFRSQAESALDSNGNKSRRGSRVFVLSEGACLMNWVTGDRKNSGSKSDEKRVMEAYRALRRKWPGASAKNREKGLLSVVQVMADTLSSHKNVETEPAAP